MGVALDRGTYALWPRKEESERLLALAGDSALLVAIELSRRTRLMSDREPV